MPNPRYTPLKISSSPGLLSRAVPHGTLKQIPKQAKVCSPEVQGWNPATCPALSSQNPEFNHPWSLQIKLPLTFTSCMSVGVKSSRSASPCQLLHHLGQEFVINAYQKPPKHPQQPIPALVCLLTPIHKVPRGSTGKLHAFPLLSHIKGNFHPCHPAGSSWRTCIHPPQHHSPVSCPTTYMWSQQDCSPATTWTSSSSHFFPYCVNISTGTSERHSVMMIIHKNLWELPLQYVWNTTKPKANKQATLFDWFDFPIHYLVFY